MLTTGQLLKKNVVITYEAGDLNVWITLAEACTVSYLFKVAGEGSHLKDIIGTIWVLFS
jgi:hypothetical protein